MMGGYACSQCDEWYDALSTTLGPRPSGELCDHASRHRYHHAPPQTPPGYWEVCSPAAPTTPLPARGLRSSGSVEVSPSTPRSAAVVGSSSSTRVQDEAPLSDVPGSQDSIRCGGPPELVGDLYDGVCQAVGASLGVDEANPILHSLYEIE